MKESAFKKGLFCKVLYCFFLSFSLLLVLRSNVFSDGNPPLWHFPAFSFQPLQVPTLSETGEDILLDNFEYFDTPYNHGWQQIEPPYPVYGFGLGYSILFNTVLDLQEGSRVLDVYRPNSVFLLGTPYQKHTIFRELSTLSLGGINGVILDPNLANPPETLPCTESISFKFRAPVGIEPWDIFEFIIQGTTINREITNRGGGYDFEIRITPVQANCNSVSGCGTSTHSFGSVTTRIIQDGSTNNPMIIQIDLGRGFLDGTWHVVRLDLNDMLEHAYENQGQDVPVGWRLRTATRILLSGRMFRVDDIMFRSVLAHRLDCPDLFEVGPRYAQIFEPYRYLFVADYEGCVMQTHGAVAGRAIDSILDASNFLTDTNDIRAAWEFDLALLGEDTNYANPNSPLYGTPNNHISALMDREGDFIIDINLPLFSDANLRISGSMSHLLKEIGQLEWNATIGGFGRDGIQTSASNGSGFSVVQPLPINPYDGMPTYIPAYYSAIDAIESTTRLFAGNSFAKPHFGPYECWVLESAIWNIGKRYWPNIAYMDYLPQVFEDIILSLEVTNGIHQDVMTFPISVVNYPVENYPPVVQIDIDDQIFHVGRENPENENKYIITFVDPDCFIFSLAQFPQYGGKIPSTSHVPGPPLNTNFRTDQDHLTFNMTADGLPSYQYGPWQEQIINPHNGLIHFIPPSEGALDMVVRCRDDRGAYALGAITIFCINPGTWLNHPPVISGGPTNPVVLRAGEEIILHAPLFNVYDPDGDELFASCNIGACGILEDRGFTWTFQTNFTGNYVVEIFFYDIRGGYAILSFPVIVKPWWSF